MEWWSVFPSNKQSSSMTIIVLFSQVFYYMAVLNLKNNKILINNQKYKYSFDLIIIRCNIGPADTESQATRAFFLDFTSAFNTIWRALWLQRWFQNRFAIWFSGEIIIFQLKYKFWRLIIFI